ncbi:MAG: hypothetical protein ACRDPE_23270 [Solirubrobacterales bacterium]
MLVTRPTTSLGHFAQGSQNIKGRYPFTRVRRVAAVGESFYQPALLAACGARRGEEVGFECIAILIAEPDNPYDSNAVRVEVEGRQVAHLSRADAVAYRAAVQEAAASGVLIACPAFIAGRGASGETPDLGIFLHLPPPELALTTVRRD